MLSILLINGNSTPAYERTALHWAAHRNQYSVVDYLLKQGVNAELRDDKNRTAAELAKGEVAQLFGTETMDTEKQSEFVPGYIQYPSVTPELIAFSESGAAAMKRKQSELSPLHDHTSTRSVSRKEFVVFLNDLTDAMGSVVVADDSTVDELLCKIRVELRDGHWKLCKVVSNIIVPIQPSQFHIQVRDIFTSEQNLVVLRGI